MDSQSPEPQAAAAAAAPVAAPGPAAGSPADFLKNIVGKRVKVRIGSGLDYHGLLTCLDGYMNVALENAEELSGGKITARYGDCFLRGNNVLYISALEDI